jgi:hypothetical protein
MDMPTARSRAEQNRARYDEVVDLVRSYARQGDGERVLLAAALAGNLAWHAPVGLLADPDLERTVLEAIGADDSDGVLVDRGRTTGRVLHVLTEGYQTGGHTRLARRWIERDSRQADIALTMQINPLPEGLRAAADATGGRLYDLRTAFPSFVARAEALRRLMNQADVVVLHVHPFDTVALAAAGLPGPRPPIVVENHADHTYWLGLGAADVVVNLRAAADGVCRERRDVPADRLVRLPLPIDSAPAATSRKSVRRELSLRPSQVAAVTVAAEYKTRPIWGEGFDAVLGSALTHCPDLVVFLVGVQAEGAWQTLQSAFPGRVRPMGVVPDVGALYPGMDVYLDSYPISSGTSILEAGATGLPVLSLHGQERYGEVYQADAPGLEHLGHAAAGLPAYLDALRKLVDDPAFRRERGDAAHQAILAAHSGPAWSEAMEQVYEQAHRSEAADLDQYPQPATDLDYAAALVPLTQYRDATPDPLALAWPLGTSLDARTRFDVSLATHPERTRRLSVRIAHGWEDNPAWTMRLTGLAKQHPLLSVSLPFVPGDDPRGTRSTRALEPVLAANGDTLADCGDLSLDLRAPKVVGPAVNGELPVDPAALDLLELLLTSPYWNEISATVDAS